MVKVKIELYLKRHQNDHRKYINLQIPNKKSGKQKIKRKLCIHLCGKKVKSKLNVTF